MKKTILISLCISLGIPSFWGCNEDKHHPYGTDDTAPGKVTFINKKDISGGAVIWFAPPSDADLLYIKAVFTDNRSITREVKVSGVIDSLVIDGYGKSGTYNVDIFAVDRSENISEGVSVEISPLTPPIQLIFPTLSAESDYGGIKVSYENAERAEVSLNVAVFDEALQGLTYRESFFTSQPSGSYSFRGYNSVMTSFGIYVEDRWGNLSDTLFFEGIPIPDEYLDKGNFRVFKITGDADFSQYGMSATQMWDEVWNSQWNCGHTASMPLPHYLTIDLGVNVKLSRFKLYQRTGTELYKHGNPKHFNVYGTKDINGLPPYNASDPCAGWTFLKECNSFKPSGLPVGVTNAEDVEFQTKGEDFEFDINDLVEIRYIRFEFLENWEGPTFQYTVIGELSFWGEILTGE
ncbi:MAG: DUF4959 domain-containing protein [Bacteroidales bacterium]|nr:DUF4959 domain-containing protein [Bacteroidales bacterium]